jgi:hypothetical protein
MSLEDNVYAAHCSRGFIVADARAIQLCQKFGYEVSYASAIALSNVRSRAGDRR